MRRYLTKASGRFIKMVLANGRGEVRYDSHSRAETVYRSRQIQPCHSAGLLQEADVHVASRRQIVALQIRGRVQILAHLEQGDHLTAGRDVYITFLQEAGAMAGLDLSGAIDRLRAAMAIIPDLAAAIRENRLDEAAACFGQIAAQEAAAYTELSEVAV